MNAHIPLTKDQVKLMNSSQLMKELEHLAAEQREYPGDYETSLRLIRAELTTRLSTLK